jgi:hypothetical protein
VFQNRELLVSTFKFFLVSVSIFLKENFRFLTLKKGTFGLYKIVYF